MGKGLGPVKLHLITFSLLLFFQFTTVCASAPISSQTEIARNDFLAAERAFKAGDSKNYQRLKERLRDYPLLPYLEYEEIRQALPNQEPVAVRAFLNEHRNTPLGKRLLPQWLDVLANRQQWQSYLTFSTSGGSIRQRCLRLQALINTRQEIQAFADVEPIWLSGHSRPKACDPAFKAWIDAGKLTTELVWQRIALAMKAGQIRLARYLKRFLIPLDQTWVERWIDLDQHPEKVENLLDRPHPMRNVMVVYGIRKLAAQDIASAIGVWEQLHTEFGFTDQQQLEVTLTLTSYLVRKADKPLTEKLARLIPPHLRLDTKLTDKWLQAYLKRKDWDKVIETIDSLPDDDRSSIRWRYWKARALLETGQLEKGHELLKDVAEHRNYYGFLAADRLGKQPNFLHQPLIIEEDILNRIANLPGMIRAHELKILGRELDARREWNMALRSATTEEFKAAAVIAREWDWPSQTIITLAKIRQWNDLELRFPLDHKQQVVRQANDHGIDSAWIYAILRQESAFATNARSSAGALGLMQLMPRTAREIATKVQHQAIESKDLFLPQINIKLGTTYLTQVYQDLQENPVLATAAYNAGPRRVKNWLPDEAQATDVWIETIPFRETREYLKRVIAYTLIYTHRLGGKPTGLPKQWLKPIESITTFNAKSRIAHESDA